MHFKVIWYWVSRLVWLVIRCIPLISSILSHLNLKTKTSCYLSMVINIIYTHLHTHTHKHTTHTHTYAYLLQSWRFKSPFQLCLFLPKPYWKMENTCMMDDEMGNNKIAHDHIYSRWEELDLGWLHRGNKMLEFKWCRGFTHMKTTKRILWMGDTLVEKGELEKKKRQKRLTSQ